MSKVENADEPAVQIMHKSASGPFVFVCEHASNRIPAAFSQLGISSNAQRSHSGWDIGALELSKFLSEKFNSPLVASTVSRLIYDCNRAPSSPTAVVQRSETEDIPGNLDLNSDQKLQRVNDVYLPFSNALSDLLDVRFAQGLSTTLVTMHSFTPVLHGQRRAVDLGILHDKDSLFADRMLEVASMHTNLLVERNQPYGPNDDVTHTLTKHAIPRNLNNVMLEIKNDLLLTPTAISEVGDVLFKILSDAITRTQSTASLHNSGNK